MFFWRKKREIEFNYKWQLLQYALKNSFSNVKNDMDRLVSSQFSTDQKLNEIFARLNRVEGILETVSHITLTKDTIQPIKQLPEKPMEIIKQPSEKEKQEVWQRGFDSLTETQKSFFLRLSVLLKESNTGWLPMKFITQDLYPEKAYEDIKPMISIFVKNMEELGFLQKTRKGRQIFLTITERGKCLLPLEKTVKKEVETR